MSEMRVTRQSEADHSVIRVTSYPSALLPFAGIQPFKDSPLGAPALKPAKRRKRGQRQRSTLIEVDVSKSKEIPTTPKLDLAVDRHGTLFLELGDLVRTKA